MSSTRHRTFSHVVRYRTYLTPPSNPFREGKSKFQVIREVMLVTVVCIFVIVVVIRSLQADSAVQLPPAALPSGMPAMGTTTDGNGSKVHIVQDKVFQNQIQKIRGDRKQQKVERDRKIIHDELEKTVPQQISQRNNNRLTPLQPVNELERTKSTHTTEAISIADDHADKTARPHTKSTPKLAGQDRQEALKMVAGDGDKAALVGSHSRHEGEIENPNGSKKNEMPGNSLVVDVQTS